jgi:hypothetical protein
LRLNGYDVEANNLGIVIRDGYYEVLKQLRNIGNAWVCAEKYFPVEN